MSVVAPENSPYRTIEMADRAPDGEPHPVPLYPDVEPPIPDDDRVANASRDADRFSPLQRPPEEDEIVVRLDNVHKTYLIGFEGVTALRGVSISVKRGEFVCILGTSGGGKTTMLNMIGTIDKPTKGDVWIGGTRIKSSTRDSLLANMRLQKLAFVFQSFNLISSMTALENVELPMLLLVSRYIGSPEQG